MTSTMTRLVVLAALVGGCATGAPPTPQIIYVTPAPTVAATAKPTVAATAKPTAKPTVAATAKPAPISYATLTSRAWAKLVKSPDTYTGKGYKLWACITQFDAATGPESFLTVASYRKETYWYTNGEPTFFEGDASKLADFVEGDVVAMSVVSLGSYSYDTQVGGNTTVPLFDVVKIVRLKGSC